MSALCVKHGKQMISFAGEVYCPACLAQGAAAAIQMVNGVRERSEAADLRERVRAAGVPSGFAECAFDNFVASTPRAEQVRDVLAGYCRNFARQRNVRPGFLFTGAPGTGKTHIACAMVHALVDEGFCAVYTSLPRLTSEIRAGFSRPGAVESLKKGLIDCDLLVLDEIDLHGTSDNDYNLLYEIINARYEKQGYPTLAISNRGLDRLNVDLDERITSRILAGSSPIHFDWPSRRELRISQRRMRLSQRQGAAGAGGAE